jgi:hypothetical protein
MRQRDDGALHALGGDMGVLELSGVQELPFG